MDVIAKGVRDSTESPSGSSGHWTYTANGSPVSVCCISGRVRPPRVSEAHLKISVAKCTHAASNLCIQSRPSDDDGCKSAACRHNCSTCRRITVVPSAMNNETNQKKAAPRKIITGNEKSHERSSLFSGIRVHIYIWLRRVHAIWLCAQSPFASSEREHNKKIKRKEKKEKAHSERDLYYALDSNIGETAPLAQCRYRPCRRCTSGRIYILLANSFD